MRPTHNILQEYVINHGSLPDVSCNLPEVLPKRHYTQVSAKVLVPNILWKPRSETQQQTLEHLQHINMSFSKVEPHERSVRKGGTLDLIRLWRNSLLPRSREFLSFNRDANKFQPVAAL